VRITQTAAAHLSKEMTRFSLAAIPWRAAKSRASPRADADLFRGNTCALVGESSRRENPRVSAFVKFWKRSPPARSGSERRSMTTRLAWHRIFRNWRPSRSPGGDGPSNRKGSLLSPIAREFYPIRIILC